MNTEVEDLFAQTLAGDYDDDAPWKGVRALRRQGTREIFEYAAAWCTSQDPLRRARGADVLGQIGKTMEHPSNSYPEESYAIVSRMAQLETDILPLYSAIYALGHIDNPSAVPLIAERRAHPNEDVRFSVACALGSFPNDSVAVEALLVLMQDIDKDVRDWATFGLGVLGNCNSPEIREALFLCLSDSDMDVREEAAVGLAKRKDLRVLTVLLAMLEQEQISIPIIEAACFMLDMESERDDWSGRDYAVALQERFAIQNGPRLPQHGRVTYSHKFTDSQEGEI